MQSGQILQITFEMLAGFVAFIVIVAVIPLIGFLWSISTKLARISERLSVIHDDNLKRDKRIDRMEERIRIGQ